ncbi:MAG: flagellar biosynthesis anti-sigma factor FlgM [Paenibacillaceae bacterium]
MKINDVNRIGSVNPYRNNTPSGNASSVVGKGKKDQVQISEEALKLLESQAAAPVDPARMKQIEQLKDAVSTGTYSVDASKVADKLLPYLNN